MDLIVLINGNLSNITQSFKLENYNSIKLDEKELVKFSKVLKILKSNSPNKVFFACKDSEFQRFIIFFKIYIMLCTGKGSVIDENGNVDKYSFSKLFLKEIPLLFIELIFSFIVILYHYIKMPIIKWIIYRKK